MNKVRIDARRIYRDALYNIYTHAGTEFPRSFSSVRCTHVEKSNMEYPLFFIFSHGLNAVITQKNRRERWRGALGRGASRKIKKKEKKEGRIYGRTICSLRDELDWATYPTHVLHQNWCDSWACTSLIHHEHSYTSSNLPLYFTHAHRQMQPAIPYRALKPFSQP